MEFQFVMKEFSRMCKWCLDNCKPNPIYDNSSITCLEDWFDDEESIKKFEETIMSWSNEHPRPKYPRFIDVLDNMIKLSGKPEWHNMSLQKILMEEIPENVAVEYGIAPINLCGIEKYNEEIDSEWR